jgi:cysteine-rich repeat protein
MVDGHAVDSEGCNSDCTFVMCGDGHTNEAAGEQCDLGPSNSDLPDAACRKDCLFPSCGDGIVDSGEECDDGNNFNNDFCVTLAGKCTVATCGDGLLRTVSDSGQPAEMCDPGAQQDGHDIGCTSEQPTCASSGPNKCRNCTM